MQRSWLWFFSILVLLAICAIVIPIVYNLGLQLTPEQLAQAQALWREKGTQDYDLSYSERTDQEADADEFQVKVRGGKVVAMTYNGQVVRFDDLAGLVLGPATRSLQPRDLSAYTVQGLLDRIEARLKKDAESPGRRNYSTLWFDSRDGHPVRYVRRDVTTKKRLEWHIKMKRR